MKIDENNVDNLIDVFSKQDAPWGLSTWINLYQCDKELITSEKAINQYVIELCDLLQVNRFGEPTIVNFGREERVQGFSMTQLIETSLVSAHFVNLTCGAYIDILVVNITIPKKLSSIHRLFSKQKMVYLIYY